MLLLRCQQEGMLYGNSHWDMDELDKVPNEAHNSETDCDSLANLNVLYDRLEPQRSLCMLTGSCRLGTTVDELTFSAKGKVNEVGTYLRSLLDKLLR